MLIRVDEKELRLLVGIALSVTPAWAVRATTSARREEARAIGKREVADRVVAILRHLEMYREAQAHETALEVLPLFPADAGPNGDWRRKMRDPFADHHIVENASSSVD